MLVLTRKKNERITVGTNITITVIDVRGDRVRLGIEAPQDVPVHRQEVAERIAPQERSDGHEPATNQRERPNAA